MSLELYMVGVVVEDMARAVEFYRRLGLDIPEGVEQKHHVELKMSGMTLFLTTKKGNAYWDPARSDRTGGYSIILEFYLKTQAAVEEKYDEMLGYGCQSHVAPYATTFNTCFAMIDDPDGNTILLSGDLGEASSAPTTS